MTQDTRKEGGGMFALTNNVQKGCRHFHCSGFEVHLILEVVWLLRFPGIIPKCKTLPREKENKNPPSAPGTYSI